MVGNYHKVGGNKIKEVMDLQSKIRNFTKKGTLDENKQGLDPQMSKQ